MQRLRHRKLVRWALAYAAATFTLLQGVDMVAAKFGWPGALERGLIIAACVGFFVTLSAFTGLANAYGFVPDINGDAASAKLAFHATDQALALSPHAPEALATRAWL